MSVSEAQIDAALQELLHERNSLGDGCFGCGSSAHWGEKQIHGRIPFYRNMLKRILEVAGQVASPPQIVSVTPPPSPAAARRRPNIGTGPSESDE